MTRLVVPLEEWPYRRLCCPHCGNQGESSFSADTFVLIGGDGLPFLVGAYADVTPDSIECHACDYRGAIEVFTQRHRPGRTAAHPRLRRPR